MENFKTDSAHRPALVSSDSVAAETGDLTEVGVGVVAFCSCPSCWPNQNGDNQTGLKCCHHQAISK
jgi:hypothetical protein